MPRSWIAKQLLHVRWTIVSWQYLFDISKVFIQQNLRSLSVCWFCDYAGGVQYWRSCSVLFALLWQSLFCWIYWSSHLGIFLFAPLFMFAVNPKVSLWCWWTNTNEWKLLGGELFNFDEWYAPLKIVSKILISKFSLFVLSGFLFFQIVCSLCFPFFFNFFVGFLFMAFFPLYVWLSSWSILVIYFLNWPMAGLITETQYVGQCLTLTYSQFWELMKSVGMLL